MFFDKLFNSKPLERNPEQQKSVNREAEKLSLYHYNACGYCMRVRRVIQRLNLPIELRDIMQNAEHRQTLLGQGGRTTVPCLRINDGNADTWMYESRNIIAYLEQRFAIG